MHSVYIVGYLQDVKTFAQYLDLHPKTRVVSVDSQERLIGLTGGELLVASFSYRIKDIHEILQAASERMMDIKYV